MMLVNTETDQVDSMFTVDAWEPLVVPGGSELFIPRIAFRDELIEKIPIPHLFQARANERALGHPDAESCIPGIELHTHRMDLLIEMEDALAQEHLIRECVEATLGHRSRPEWDRLARMAGSLARGGA